MSEFYKILGKSGSDNILFAHKAALLLDDNMVDDALNLCEMGVKKFPFYAEGHYVLGRCYQMFERYDDAKNEFERTLTFAPGHVRAMGALAYVFYKKKLKKMGNRYLLKNAVHEPNNQELIEYLEAQGLYGQLFKSPIIEAQLSADLDGFLPDEREKEDLRERVEKTFGMSDETRRILKKDQVDLAEESYKDQDTFEVKNIIDSLDEGDTTPKTGIDLSQYANVEDDFSTLMGDFLVGGEEDDSTSKEADETRADKPSSAALDFESDMEETGNREENVTPPVPDFEKEMEENAVAFSPDMPAGPEQREDKAAEKTSEAQENEDTVQTEQEAFSDLLMDKKGTDSDEMPAFDSKDLDAMNVLEDEDEPEALDVFNDTESVFAEDPVVPEEKPLPETPAPETEKQEPATEADADETLGPEEKPESDQKREMPEPESKPEDKQEPAVPPKPEVKPQPDAKPEAEQDLIFARREPRTAPVEQTESDDDEKTMSIDEIMANPSLVTPTFGEILISQRKFAEARHVFLKLWERHPDNPRFKEKVEFLDKLIKLQV